MSTDQRRFPIMMRDRYTKGGTIPWSVIAPHESQAQKNHSQSLSRLAERKGLSPIEAIAVLEGREFPWGANYDTLTVVALEKLKRDYGFIEAEEPQ